MQLVSNSFNQSLESKYIELASQISDWDQAPFGDYREPNEGNPQNIGPHLSRAWDREGITVVAGFQRAFFHLIFSNHRLCQGLVIRDINPQIIGAAHFNILLLRISQDLRDYADISAIPERREEVRQRVFESNMPEQFREFYLSQFDSLASLYYGSSVSWKNGASFQKVHYHKSEEQFGIIQSYAKAGNIIATLGDIGDLNFFDSHEVVIVDTSNISDYCIMNIQCANRKRPPTMIWTEVRSTANFWSRELHPLSPLEEIEMNRLISIISDSQNGAYDQREIVLHAIGGSNINPPVYSQEVLRALQIYVEKWLIELPHIGWVCLDVSKFHHSKFKDLTPSQMRDICSTARIENYVEALSQLWSVLDIGVYSEFSNIEGWREAFFKVCHEMRNFDHFGRRFASFPLFQEFQSNHPTSIMKRDFDILEGSDDFLGSLFITE